MATLLLGAAGSALGGATGIGWLSTVGQAVGAAAGAVIDQSIINLLSPGRSVEGSRLTNVNITGSTEGAAITRMVGRSRLGGQMIWATRFEEQKETEEQGGKGGGGVKTTTYTYFGNFAVAFCEGTVARIGRLWADGREIDQEAVTVRKYLGTDTQNADSLIETKEGAGNAPAYRGIAYVIFERLDLTEYGNRMPSITAEIFRAEGDLEPLIEAVTLIPGSTEFGYEPAQINRKLGEGAAEAENRHTLVTQSDLTASLDQLGQLAPNCESVSLVVAWFGDDLRAGNCTIRPKVETANKETEKQDGGTFPWIVAGLTRADAEVISQVNGKPAFGGSPNDASVIACIQELKARGHRVVVYPFIMMDVPAANALPNPYSDNESGTGQDAYPWRGRITISPAPGYAGSPDKTAAAASQIDAFVGTAEVADFASSSGSTVTYTGPDEWSYRRFILHMAKLCQLAGGVDSFCIGSEMVALTTSRSAATAYPFVDALGALAGDVRSMLGTGVEIGYAADWSEYHSHRPADGSGDVIFHLDPLWADPDLDFVGIDNYLPLADWRDGSDHLDYDPAGPTTTYDRNYLEANIESGEYFDWFYASQADRHGQMRTLITDGAYGKPWVYRNKDIRSWWLSRHYNRSGGVEDATPTAWTPESKPVWFTEIGCPAIDKGANQPNVFFDPKSSESAVPYFSSGERDDAMQRAFLETAIGYWSDPANNPQSSVYPGPMIDTSSIFIWTWDSRPGPSFPQDGKTWADAPNWEFGHWLSGRLGAAPAREALSTLMDDFGFTEYAIADIGAVVDGVVIDDLTTARSAFESISTAYLAYAVESEGLIRFRSRLGEPLIAEYGLDQLMDGDAGEPLKKTRQQETDLPRQVKLSYSEPTNDDQAASVLAKRLIGRALGTNEISLPVVMPGVRARTLAEIALHDAWASRESAEYGLGPSELALDGGDIIRITWPSAETWRISEIADGDGRRIKAARVETELYSGGGSFPARDRGTVSVPALAPPVAVFLDGPLLADDHSDYKGYIAAYSSPWPGGIAFYRSPETSGYTLDTILPVAATMGELAFDFYSGPVWRWDRVNELWVDMYSGTLSSVSELQALAGVNALAIENADGEWEVLTFATAELQSSGRYKLSGLLRGLRGSEHAMRDPVAAGARVIVLNTAMAQPDIKTDHLGIPLNWRVGPSKRDASDPSYVESQETVTGKGRRPLSPVHVRGHRDPASGDITITWMRRTRIGGDGWDQVDVPLGEESEAYEIDVLNGSDQVVRTIGASSQSATYTAAEQSADGIALPFDVIAYQLSATFGRGIGERATING